MEIYNGRKVPAQEIYDAYNTFILSQDKDVFFKLLQRYELFQKIRNLNGDIVECGVFKGTGMMVWLKFLIFHSPHDIRRVIGFDFFEKNFVDKLPEHDREMMSKVFSRVTNLEETDISVEGIKERFTKAEIPCDKFELVKGNVVETCQEYVKNRPGFRISLLYMDLDLEEPTYAVLSSFWDKIVKGGVIVFDEYGYHVWSESNAVDRFIKEKGLFLQKTGVKSPTAYIVKS